MDRPIYPHDPVRRVQSLCCALGEREGLLRSIAERVPNLYIGPKSLAKKNGGVRFVFDTKAPLKPLLKRINTVFFRKVQFPEYLTGSLSGRDFVANVEIHKNAHIAITEDVEKFFDNITDDHVYKIWRYFFKFSESVSTILTRLTTNRGKLIQGAPTSPYLANLAFWHVEPALVERLADRKMRYSRYVDDITISSISELSKDDKSWAIAQIYGMIGGAGFRARRDKHEIFPAKSPITIMGLNANSPQKPTLTKGERARIRAQVFQIEQRVACGEKGPELRSTINQTSGKIGRLKRLHK